MTTTAFDDQYLVAPDSVREPMSREAILHRNIADLEIALRAQTELKERAEAELAKLAQQEPIKYLYRVTDCFGHDVLRDDPRDATIIETIPLYAAPVSAPAVPAEWREFVESVPDYLSNYRDKHDHYGPVLLKEQARALLQSAEVRHD